MVQEPDVTALLIEVANGNQAAQEKLVPLVYDQLKSWPAGTCGASDRSIPCRPLLWFMKLISNWLASILPTGRTALSSMGLLPN